MNSTVYLRQKSDTKAKKKEVQSTTAPLVQTVFHEPWWLDIACDGNYKESVVRSGGLVVGRLPYRISRRPFGLTILDMPLLVHVLGPAIAPQFAGDHFPRSLKEFAILGELLAQLPSAVHTSFRLHGGMTNTLAFEAAGFRTSTAYTVEVAPDTRESLWLRMRDKTRNVIRRAEERLVVSVSEDVDRFLDFYEANLRQRGRKNEYDRRVTRRLITECQARKAGRILIATDDRGLLEAAVLTVWDCRQEFYFMSTRRADSMNGATSLLIWEGIQHASSRGLVFDMDCLHVNNGAVSNLLLLTGFGGVVRPRYQVHKTAPALHVAREFVRLMKPTK